MIALVGADAVDRGRVPAYRGIRIPGDRAECASVNDAQRKQSKRPAFRNTH
jgi:hypothetical protein